MLLFDGIPAFFQHHFIHPHFAFKASCSEGLVEVKIGEGSFPAC